MHKKHLSCSTIRPIERVIRALAGAFVTISVALGYFVSPWWFIFTLFVGVNLFQSSITRWCLTEQILAKMGIGVEEKS